MNVRHYHSMWMLRSKNVNDFVKLKLHCILRLHQGQSTESVLAHWLEAMKNSQLVTGIVQRRCSRRCMLGNMLQRSMWYLWVWFNGPLPHARFIDVLDSHSNTINSWQRLTQVQYSTIFLFLELKFITIDVLLLHLRQRQMQYS